MYSHPQNLHSSDFIELASWNHEITRVNSWFQLYRVNFLLFPWQKWRWIRIFLINHFCCKRMFPHRKMPFLYATLSQPHAELIKRSLTGSDISKYNKSWPHVTSSISEWKKPSGRSNLFACYQRDARRSNCSSSLCFHSHATVPHIVALPDFSFHVAKIESIFVNSKFLSSECNKCLHLYCWVVKKFARRVNFLRGNLSKSHFFLVLFDKITFFYYLCRRIAVFAWNCHVLLRA